jgi:hypothetical protein
MELDTLEAIARLTGPDLLLIAPNVALRPGEIAGPDEGW